EDLLEHRDAARPVPLEERRLGLDRGDAPPDRLDDPQAELTQPRGVVGQAPVREQTGVRVDADAQRAVVVHRRGEPRAEPRAHAPTRSGAAGATPAVRPSPAMCSCRLATANGPARTASMPWTAAASWSTVVAIGLSAAVVAARIS